MELPDSPHCCPVTAYETLLTKRPSGHTGPDSPLFLRPFVTNPIPVHLGDDFHWFYRSRVGKNYIGKFVDDMVKLAKIDPGSRRLSNTSVRKNVGTTLRQSGEGTSMIMQQMGHVNPASLSRYDTPSSEDCTRVTQTLYSSSSNSNKQPLNVKPSSTSTAAPCSEPAQPPNGDIQLQPEQLSDPCSSLSLKRGPSNDVSISNKKTTNHMNQELAALFNTSRTGNVINIGQFHYQTIMLIRML